MTDKLKPFLEDMLSMSTSADGRTLKIYFSRPVTNEDRQAFADAHNAIVRGELSPPPPPAPHLAGNEAILTALENIGLPVVGHLFVARGGASARITSHELANGPDESSYLVRLSDVTKALEPIRAALADTSAPAPQVMAPADYQEKLSGFLDALDEWGCDDNGERAEHIIEFQRTGYDLDAYLEDHPDRPKQEVN